MKSERGAAIAHRALAVGLLLDDPEGSVSSAEAASRLTADAPVDVRLSVLNRALIAMHHQGLFRTDRAQCIAAEASELAQNSGDLLQRFSVESNLGVAHLDIGDLDRAEVHFRAARRLLGQSEMTFPRINLECNEGELALARQDYRRAQASFAAAAEHSGRAIPRYARDIATAGLGFCAIEQGAVATARRLEEQLSSHPRIWYYDPSLVLRFQARLFERQGRRDLAAQVLAEGEAAVEGRLIPGWLKIRLARSRLLRKTDGRASLELARAGKAVAAAAGFESRCRDFDHLLDNQYYV